MTKFDLFKENLPTIMQDFEFKMTKFILKIKIVKKKVKNLSYSIPN